MIQRKTGILVAALVVTAAMCSAQNLAPVPPETVVERDLVYAQAGGAASTLARLVHDAHHRGLCLPRGGGGARAQILESPDDATDNFGA
jgi:hypothetical protein